MVEIKPRKIFITTRVKNETSTMGTHYTKFINRLFRRGLKTKCINFFYMLNREHKQQTHAMCKWKFGKDYDITILSANFTITSFGDLVTSVFKMLILRLELKVRRYRKKEIFVPTPVAPWRGFRLGLTLFFKNVKNRIQHIKVHRKQLFFHKLLGELWDTYYYESATRRTILEFTENVLANSRNYKSARIHPVREGRRQPVQNNKVKKQIKVKYNEKRIRRRAVELIILKKTRMQFKRNTPFNYKSKIFFTMLLDPRQPYPRRPVYFRGYQRHSRQMFKRIRSEKSNFSKFAKKLKSAGRFKFENDKFRELLVNNRQSVIK